VIGAGILRAPTSIAALVPNGAAMLALWVAGGLVTALGINIVAELATAIPRDGGSYAWVHQAFGDTAGLAVGWTLAMSICCGIAALSMSFADFLAWIWPIGMRARHLVAAAAQLGLFGINLAGLRSGAIATHVTSMAKVLAIVGFVAAALIVAPRAHAAIGTVVAQARSAPIGFAALIGAYQLIGGAYSGWEAPTAFGAETTDPERTLPKSLYLGLIVSCAVYLIVISGLLIVLGVRGIAASDSPFSEIMQTLLGRAAGASVAAIAMLMVLSCANADVMTAPRYLYALAEDRLIPAAFAGVNRGGTPQNATLLVALISLALTLSGSFDLVFGLIATLGAVTSILVYSAFFALRLRRPDLPRPYRALGYPLLPALALLIAVASFVLFMHANGRGALVAIAVWVLCVPLAMLAKRGRANGR